MSSKPSRADELREVFETVTGTDRVVEPQDQDAATSADGDASDVVTEVRLEAVRNDGIADASDDTAYSR